MHPTVEPVAHDAARAADVVVRVLRWVLKPGVAPRARYVEATLTPWLTGDVAAPLGVLAEHLAGFDALDGDGREARLPAIAAALEALEPLRAAGDIDAPRAVLLPEGQPERAPRAAPAPAATVVDAAAAPVAAEESPTPEGRSSRRDDRRERRDRERDERRRARSERAEPAEIPAAAKEPVAPPPVVVTPPPPPEPRQFPLGHPEGTGMSLAGLGVLDASELDVLATAGIATVADLLLLPPSQVERGGERWNASADRDAASARAVIVRGVVSRRCVRYAGGVRREELVLEADRGERVTCRWYAPPSPEVVALRAGAEVGLCGRVEWDEDVPVMLEGEVLGLDGRGGDWFARYELSGIDDARVRAAMRAAFRMHLDQLADHLPAELLEKHRLVALPVALRDAHFPSNASRKGKQRLGFDELLQVQLGVALMRQRERRERGVANPVTHTLLAQAHGMLGWSFTDEQEAAFDDVRRDLRRTQPMARLLQGDVGVGKHAIVQGAMLLVAEDKHQAVFIAPDAVCAEHRFLFAEGFFRSVGIEPMLVTGTPSKAQAEEIKKGDALVIYATPNLLRDVPAFRKLGLVVFEEHGPYGIADVSAFEAHGHRPDMLVFTPTPVPSAIALNLYGSLSLSVMATGQTRGVDTHAFDAAERDTAYARAREAVEAGQQVIIAFPLVRGADLLSPSEARRLAQVLAEVTFPGAKIGIFNGAMSREERFRAYDDFQHQRTQVLLATSYVEHGPIVPNATVMIVEYAEQFDLVRLHRLRGHVGNGWRRGQCLLVRTPEGEEEEARHRLDLLLRETDGFRIAELDIRHRGVDAVLGERAADAPDFAWADPVSERDVLLRTRQEAMRMLTQDPGLRRRMHRALLHLVRVRFGDEVGGDGEERGHHGGHGHVAHPAAAPRSDAAGSGAAASGANGRRRRRRRGR